MALTEQTSDKLEKCNCENPVSCGIVCFGTLDYPHKKSGLIHDK